MSANLAAADSDASGGINIGTGRETDVLEIARILGVDYDHAPARLGELERSWIDVTRAREVLGWTAGVELEDGMRRTLEWSRAVAA